MQEEIICPICKSPKVSYISTVIGYKEPGVYKVMECYECSTSFIDPFKTDKRIYELIYKHSENVIGYNRYFKYAQEVLRVKNPLEYLAESELSYWAVYQALRGKLLNKNSRILEVGSGLGYLTYSLHKEGYNINGIDISANAVESATKSFGNLFHCLNIFDATEEYKHQFDFIVLTEVIEHVELPAEFIQCLMGMLNEKGSLLITTPNKSIKRASDTWDSDFPPVHLSWFSEKSMIKIGNKVNAIVSFIDFTEYNKKHFDIGRLKLYKTKIRNYVFDSNDNLVMKTGIANKSVVKENIKKVLSFLCSFPILDKLLTRKEYPINRASTMAAIFTKKVN